MSPSHTVCPAGHCVPRWAALWYRWGRVSFRETSADFAHWWSEFDEFLADDTVYRSRRELDAAFARYFQVRHVEREKLNYHLRLRLGGQLTLPPFTDRLVSMLETRRVGLAFEVRPVN